MDSTDKFFTAVAIMFFLALILAWVVDAGLKRRERYECTQWTEARMQWQQEQCARFGLDLPLIQP